MQRQRLSRLELYLEILLSIGEKINPEFDDVRANLSLSDHFLTNSLVFLEKKGLIDKEFQKNKIIYKTTPKGVKVASFFTVLPANSENQKDFCFT